MRERESERESVSWNNICFCTASTVNFLYFRSCVKALDIDAADELVLSDFIHTVGSEHLVNSKVDKL